MRCMQKGCEKRASVHITVIEQGAVSEQHLCQEHGMAEQFSLLKAAGPEGTSAASSDPAKLAQTLAAQVNAGDAVCPQCAMDWKQFIVAQGRLGCARDYETFSEQLGPVLAQTQNSVQHVGKYPKRTDRSIAAPLELARLKDALERAVGQEDFEAAAKYRDRIQQLESGSGPPDPEAEARPRSE